MQIRRNAILPRLFVMLPLVLLIVVPFAANQEIKNLKFCVVDNDHSSFSYGHENETSKGCMSMNMVR